MILHNIRLHNFRNYKNLETEFCDGVHLLIGKNAQGKTNLLESILYVSTTRSHRTNDDSDLIREGETAFFIKASIKKEHKTQDMQITVNEKGKNLFIYQNSVNKVSDFIGEFNAVMFCPDDMALFNASPRVRRRFIDMELSKVSKKYVATLFVASRLLKERNAYLKQLHVDIAYLEVLTSQLIDAQVVILKQRHFYLKQLLKQCEYFYQQISKDDTLISVSYDSCVPFEEDTEKLRLSLQRRYTKTLERDLYLKQTTTGIHKEDFVFEINGKEVATYASQGQKRSILLSLKIGMIYMIEEIIHEYPVLLLDDVFSELDEFRRHELLTFLPKDVQIFISTTDVIKLEEIQKFRKVTIWKVENGKIEEC